jgi:hypothetical protein
MRLMKQPGFSWAIFWTLLALVLLIFGLMDALGARQYQVRVWSLGIVILLLLAVSDLVQFRMLKRRDPSRSILSPMHLITDLRSWELYVWCALIVLVLALGFVVMGMMGMPLPWRWPAA